MQVTKGAWRMRKQCVPGSLSSTPAQEPGNEASYAHDQISHAILPSVLVYHKLCNTGGGMKTLE